MHGLSAGANPARLRHVAVTKWGTKRYLQINRLAEIVASA
jgi:hypothetical protein